MIVWWCTFQKKFKKKIWCQWHFEVFKLFLKIEGVIRSKCANDKKWLYGDVLSKNWKIEKLKNWKIEKSKNWKIEKLKNPKIEK